MANNQGQGQGPKNKLLINHKNYEWPEQYITGAQVRTLGNIPSEDELFLAMGNPHDDEPINDNTTIDLARPGIGQFYSKPKQREIRIIVNGTPHVVNKDTVTYAEVVTLAFPDYPQHPERTYSVTYDKGPKENPAGILSPGGSVNIKNEMVFYVKHTGQS